MANIWEKAISILAGNLNTGFSYLITTVRLHHRLSKFDRSVFVNLKAISYFFGIFMAWFLI
jgi:hypothetical protein